jgi:hypothetical protein
VLVASASHLRIGRGNPTLLNFTRSATYQCYAIDLPAGLANDPLSYRPTLPLRRKFGKCSVWSFFLKICSTVLAFTAISSTFVPISCGGGSLNTASESHVTISTQAASVPVYGTQTFSATVTNSAPVVTWGITDSQLSSPVGPSPHHDGCAYRHQYRSMPHPSTCKSSGLY